ncbi:MAG: insulinase family protein [Proteobacteria bacterium]|jgi:predicted Zn-dependent peptidase|nr:insulinase family protein [Pseudomonadota bacterium]
MDYELERGTTANGLRVVAVRQPHLHRGTISAYVGAGSRFETAEENGLSHFLEHMVFRGTERFPTAFELNVAVELLGGTLIASTAPDATALSVSLPCETLLRGVELVAEVLTRPVFDAIDVERKILVEEIREDLDEHGRNVDIDFLSRSRLWPDHPLGRSVTGPIANVLRFGLGDLRRWLGARYCARNTVLCVAGSFDSGAITDAIARAFSPMREGAPAACEAAPRGPTGASALHVDKPGSQTALRVAFRAPGLADPDLSAAELLLRLLDDGMSTPLHRRVFEDRGLAYNIAADLETYADTGALNVDAVCSHENVVQVAEEVLAILRELRDLPLADADLEKAKSRAVWSLERHLDDPEAMSAWYGEQELLCGVRRLAEEARAIRELGADDIARAAARIVSGSSLHVTTVGVLGERQRQALVKLAEGGA